MYVREADAFGKNDVTSVVVSKNTADPVPDKGKAALDVATGPVAGLDANAPSASSATNLDVGSTLGKAVDSSPNANETIEIQNLPFIAVTPFPYVLMDGETIFRDSSNKFACLAASDVPDVMGNNVKDSEQTSSFEVVVAIDTVVVVQPVEPNVEGSPRKARAASKGVAQLVQGLKAKKKNQSSIQGKWN
ncbi:hypothetical protein V6N12_014890 [Hibiscus sabdariffa]|uniref:Uncharacterized protein n=1 Tax=Hibiscus sabdariffa TaxID=183260 RepID=A0ABR2DLY0_9ROSI